jgi:hypothetical protein
MSNDNIQRQMDFIIAQQARFSVDIEQLKEAQKQQSANLDRLTADVQSLTQNVSLMQSEMRDIRSEMRGMQSEMRDAINNLIIANEVTRKLAEDVAQLAIATSKRVSVLEAKERERQTS